MSTDTKERQREHILEGLDILTRPGQVTELRIPKVKGGGRRTDAGYFDDRAKLADAALSYDGRVPGIYITLNPVKPELLARYCNRVVPYADATTGDADIERRCWLPIDVDPVRPSLISSTDAEHQAALVLAVELREWLDDQGWPEPAALDSGNGAHLLYPIDLPNDGASADLVQNCLLALAYAFDRAWDNLKLAIDTGVFNAGRIWKLPGTRACKGDHVPDRPHRYARLLSAPESLSPVCVEQLHALAALAPPPQGAGSADSHVPGAGGFDVAAFVARHAERLRSSEPKVKSYGTVWSIDCPFREDHGHSAAITWLTNGHWSASCKHNSCSWSKRELREYLEGPTQAGKQAQPEPQGAISDQIEQILSVAWGYTFSENELTGEITFDDSHTTIPLDDAVRARLRMEGRDAGFGGKGKPSLGALSDMILILARRNRQHPVRDRLERLVWDGQKHLVALCRHFSGPLDPIDYGNGLRRPVFNVWLYHWLLGAVARAYQGGEIQNPMLALQGSQGIGKSHFGAWLASPFGGDYFVESAIDPHSNEHLRYLAGKFIWQVAEVGSTTRRADRQALKEFMTLRSVTVRRPYDRDPTTRPALANFLGTLNNETGFLSDPTGNRRFLVAEVAAIDWAYATAIDPAQLWAEMVHRYKSGAQVALSPVEATRRDEINEEYMTPTNEKEAIQTFYEIDRSEEDWVEFTVDIVLVLGAKGFHTNVTAVGLALRDLLGRPNKRELIGKRRGMCARCIRQKLDA